MAQTTQIVPKFQFPHVMTVVNDYTKYTDETQEASDDSVKFLAVFRSSKGIDNVLVKKTEYSDFVSTYGTGNYKEYGQPIMMPLAELQGGRASVWCMRVMPEGARYAHSILSLYYKADVENKKFRIKFKAKSLSGDSAIKSKDDLYVKGQMLDGEGTEGVYVDSEGYTQVPLMVFRMEGRGTYGNSCRWRIAINQEYEKDYGIKLYSFEALSTESGLERLKTYVGSICTSKKYRETTLINDILDEADAGVAPMDVQVYEDNVEMVYEKYVDFLESVAEENPDLVIEVPDLDEFDPLFGLKVGSTEADPFIQIVSTISAEVDTSAEGYDEKDYTTETVIQLDNVEGTPLAGGSEGEFATTDQTAKDKAIEECYCKAFSGEYDRLILSNRRIPVTALFDANYPFAVKEKLANLAILRDDAMLFLDCGLLQSFSENNLKNITENYAQFNVRGISKNPQWYYVRDSITNKKVAVTVTYFFAQNYASHLKENGTHIPFVKSYAQLSGHVKNSLQPPVELYEDDLRETLYNNRFNYFEAINENVFQRACQNTSQIDNSDLLEESNMMLLFEIKRTLEDDAYKRLYNFANAEDRDRFKKYEEAKFANWIGRKLYSFAIRFDMNEWEAERSILHCYVEVQFRTLNKRTIIEIDVNKRDFTA